jgi:hypothetical protein
MVLHANYSTERCRISNTTQESHNAMQPLNMHEKRSSVSHPLILRRGLGNVAIRDTDRGLSLKVLEPPH